MEIKNEKANKIVKMVREILFFFCLGVFLIQRLFTRVTYWKLAYGSFAKFDEIIHNLYFTYTVPLLLVSIVIMFLTTKPDIRRILGFTGLIILGRIVSDVGEDIYFNVGMMLVVAAYGINAKKILIFIISLNIPLLLMTVVASQMGKIENLIDPGRNREYLGYTWTTTPVMIFTYAVFAYMVLRKGKISIPEYLILNAVNAWFFLKTNTRFAFLLVFLCLTFFFVYRVFYDINRRYGFERNTLIVLPWLFFGMIYTVTAEYDPDNKILSVINRVLSNRLKQCQYSLGKFGIRAFGQPISWVTYGNATSDNPADYVDSAYLQIFLKYGWVALLALLFISSYIIYRAYKTDRCYLALVYAFIILFGLFEQQLFWFEYDALILIAFADWKQFHKEVKQVPCRRIATQRLYRTARI